MAIAPFAELERSPEHVHTYRLTPLGLWNARAAGHDAEEVVDALVRFSRYPVPQRCWSTSPTRWTGTAGCSWSTTRRTGWCCSPRTGPCWSRWPSRKKLAAMLGARIDEDTIACTRRERGRLKQALLKVGWPAEDLAGYVDGEAHPIALRQDGWAPAAVPAAGGRAASGPAAPASWCCPAAPARRWSARPRWPRPAATTLILVTNTVAGRQWKRELIARTSLTEEEIGEYSGERKEIRPVTIATYQVMTTRRGGVYTHLDLFDSRDWGLVIYDEVHLLPAPIFRITADLQARRRLGLTATLVREDGREGDVFSLIGPKRYDAPWKDIESQGWIAPAECIEVRVTLTDAERMAYATAEPEERYRFAATARTKLPVVRKRWSSGTTATRFW